MGLPYGENFIILTSTVFMIHPSDRQMDEWAIAYTRYSIYAVARKKKERQISQNGFATM